ncbi:MAG: LysR family transcriptional regulator [Acidimicrobiales bacterium]
MAPTTLERLAILDAVASAGTIAGAARSLGYTPSAVSQQLATLEQEARTALVERSNRGVSLTAAGQLLAQRGGEILDGVRSAFDDIDTAANRARTPLVVAAFPTAIVEILLPLRARLAATIDLSIVDAESEHALHAVSTRSADGALIDGYAHQLRPALGNLDRTAVRTESIRMVTRPDRLHDTFAAYADAEWVIAGPASPIGHALRQLCHDTGFVPRVIAETDDHRITFDVIRACGAVSLLPELALADLPDDLVVVDRVAVPIERRIEFVTRRSLSAHRAIVTLVEALEEDQPSSPAVVG